MHSAEARATKRVRIVTLVRVKVVRDRVRG